MAHVDPEILRTRLDEAWADFLAEHQDFGGHRYHGWDHADDPENYYGPRFWSEADCAFRLGRHLETQFPGQVHFEMPVASWTFADYDKAKDKRERVDLVVSDLAAFEESGTSQERFRNQLHSIFIEAKFFPSGCSKTWRYDHVRKVDSVVADAGRLQRHLDRGHCIVAAIFVVDDDRLFTEESASKPWPADVLKLIAAPAPNGG